MRTPLVSLLLLLALAPFVTACGSHTPIAKARNGALLAARSAHDLKVIEDQLYSAHVVASYTQAQHFAVQDKLKLVLASAAAYDDVAKSLHEGQPVPAAVVDAARGLQTALEDLSKTIPNLGGAERGLKAAVASLEAGLLTYLGLPPMTAELPAPGLLGLLLLLGNLVQSGKMAYTELAAIAKKNGATDEELEAAKQTDLQDIADIDAERAKG